MHWIKAAQGSMRDNKVKLESSPARRRKKRVFGG
jgi:hypothetical protein